MVNILTNCIEILMNIFFISRCARKIITGDLIFYFYMLRYFVRYSIYYFVWSDTWTLHCVCDVCETTPISLGWLFIYQSMQQFFSCPRVFAEKRRNWLGTITAQLCTSLPCLVPYVFRYNTILYF